MTALVWDATSEHFYELGVDRGVFYPEFAPGEAWNGLVSVQERIVNRTVASYYRDGSKFLEDAGNGDFEATITAVSAPYDFYPCDGSAQLGRGLLVTQQSRQSFGMSYRTLIGNDTQGNDRGYKIHLVYNAVTSPYGASAKTTAADTDPSLFVWLINTTPMAIPGKRPTAHLVVDSRKVDSVDLASLEDVLYGSSGANATLPPPATVLDILGAI